MLTRNDFHNLILPDELYETTIYTIIKQLRAVDRSIKYGFGSTRLAIITAEEVIKIPYYFHCEDRFINYESYCDKECLTYDAAKGIGLDKFFASAEWAGMIDDSIPFYCYEKINLFSMNYKRPTQKSKQKANKTFADIDPNWLGLCYDYYGDELVNDFIYFLDEREINDLHSDNIGFRQDGSPCVCDYAGFS